MALRAEGVPFVHATVVLADRPTSAKPGDEALVFADGTIEGFVGGACAESTGQSQSLALLDSGEPLLLRITATPDATPPGPGPAGASARLSVHNPCLSGGTLEIFLEPVVPAPLLVVHGEGPIAVALTQLAAGLGYQVATEPTAPPAHAAAVVCASHGRDEEETLAAALEAGVGYVGLVASRKRGEQVVAGLEAGRQGAGAHLPGSTSEPGRHRRWRCRSWPRSWRSGARPPAARSWRSRRHRARPAAPGRGRPGVRHVGGGGGDLAAPRPRRHEVLVLWVRLPAGVRGRPCRVPRLVTAPAEPQPGRGPSRPRTCRGCCPMWPR